MPNDMATAAAAPAPAAPAAAPNLAVVPPAAGGGAATPGPTQPPSAAQQAAAAAWYKDFPDDVRGYIENKKWGDPKSVVEGYRNLEKFHGVPQERLIKLPEKMDDASMREIHKKLGLPEKPDGYEVKVPTGLNPEFADWAKGLFHEAGLSKAQGDKIAAKWTDRVTALNAGAETAQVQANEQAISKLRTEWGAAFEQNSATVNALANAMGMTREQSIDIGKVLGVDNFNKMMLGLTSKFGIKFGEDQFFGNGPNNGTGNNFGQMSPEAAKERIKERMADTEWAKRYTKGGVDEAREMQRLHVWAQGERI